MKRFSKCREWFEWVINKIRPEGIISYPKPKGLEEYTFVALDASDVTEKGATKRIWRLHYAIDIFGTKSLQYKITSEKTGESLTHFMIKPEYVIIGDRAYGSKTSIEHCMKSNANFILRIKRKAFTLITNNLIALDEIIYAFKYIASHFFIEKRKNGRKLQLYCSIMFT